MYRMPRRLPVMLAGLALALVGCETPPAEETGERPVAADDAEAAPDSAMPEAPAQEPVGDTAGAAPDAPAPEPAREEPPAPAEPAGPVREATAAGPRGFYTSDPEALHREVSGYVAAAKKVDLPGRVIAVIAPHAGYGFSGPAAGWAYRQLEGADVETVVLIGGHAGGLGAATVWPAGAWKTPLGSVPVDAAFARALVAEEKGKPGPAAADTRPHVAPIMNGRPDHALEVQVPFIQVVLPRAKIVPVYFNTDDPAAAARLGERLAGAMKGRKAVIVASTDLSHFPDADTAAVVDKAILDAIVSLDAERIVAADRRLMATYRGKNLQCTICAMGGVLATVEGAKRLGATGARLVAYDHSGNRVQKNRGRVVGYGAVAIYGPPAPAAARATGRMFSDQERTMLLALARKSIELEFEGKELPKLAGLPPALETKAPAFVTLTNKGRLRGCMGMFDWSQPVWQVVADRARESAFRDPRPGLGDVTKEELPEIEIEISVLSPLRKLDDPLSIELGRDGILLRSVDRRRGGTYLPQVATETGWTKEEFLSHCCSSKAGLPGDAWRDPKQVTVYAYRAEVFSEGELRAKARAAGETGTPEKGK